ncbi:hypothetical protein QUF75_02885 [Desulfococcaceae bacterium HSG7]|nr:hypothetical protein [Desulfococcaceae bacterium HSG7]
MTIDNCKVQSNIIERINSLSPEQTTQILDWFTADLQDEKGIVAEYEPSDITVILTPELADFNQDPVKCAKKLLKMALKDYSDQIVSYLDDCTDVRGFGGFEGISIILPLALALYFSLDFKAEYEVMEEDGLKKKRKKIVIKSRKISAPFMKFMKGFLTDTE